MTADYCLNSIPFQLMAGIANNFPSDYAAVLTAIPRGKLFKIGFQMRERFWEREQIYGGISWTTQDITQIWYPCHGIHRPKGVVLGAYVFGGDAADRFERMTPAQRLAAAIKQGERIHPDYGKHVEAGVSIPWHRMNNMLGCAAEWDPEARERYFDRIQAPAGRHYMIGDQVSYHSGWQQGAMHSALHAIADIDARERGVPAAKGMSTWSIRIRSPRRSRRLVCWLARPLPPTFTASAPRAMEPMATATPPSARPRSRASSPGI
jgi:monoamine oxidase